MVESTHSDQRFQELSVRRSLPSQPDNCYETVTGRESATAAPAGYLDIKPLARACRSPALTVRDRHAAGSLLERWSRTEGELTARQWALAAVLARKVGPAPDAPSRSGYVPQHAAEGRWWLDTSSWRQARRGVKSGCVRRHQTRERDAKIARWVNRRRFTVRDVAQHVGMAASTVSRIASRARGGAGFWRGPTKRWPLPPSRPRRPLRQPSWSTPRAHAPAVSDSRNTSIFTSLTAWSALRSVRSLPDSAVQAEAEHLNSKLARPLRPAELARIARSVCRRRLRFAQHPAQGRRAMHIGLGGDD